VIRRDHRPQAPWPWGIFSPLLPPPFFSQTRGDSVECLDAMTRVVFRSFVPPHFAFAPTFAGAEGKFRAGCNGFNVGRSHSRQVWVAGAAWGRAWRAGGGVFPPAALMFHTTMVSDLDAVRQVAEITAPCGGSCRILISYLAACREHCIIVEPDEIAGL